MTTPGNPEAGPSIDRWNVLEGFIDHAPLFPPAELPPPQAVARYRVARREPRSHCLHALVWPLDRLDELQRLLDAERRAVGLAGAEASPALVSGLGVPPAHGFADFESRVRDNLARIVQLEGRWPDAADDQERMLSLYERFDGPAYLEIPVAGVGPEAVVDQVRNLGDRARRAGVGLKVRCGGPSPAAVPTAAELAAFLWASVATGVVVKATAGLHHAWPDLSAAHPRHGLGSLLHAAAASVAGADVDVVADRLGDPRPVPLSRCGVVAARTLLRSIGSCSFEEPLDDLEPWIVGGPDRSLAPEENDPTSPERAE